MMHRLALCLLLLLVPGSTLASPWLRSPGGVLLKASFHTVTATDRFAAVSGFDPTTGDPVDPGDRTPYFFDGESTTRLYALDAWLGLAPGWQAHAHVPVYRSAFTDLVDSDRPATSGFGDIRLGLARAVLAEPVTLAVEAGIKLPTGESQGFGEAEVVPLGEGQWDVEAIVHAGRSLYPVPGYVQASTGYRWRAKNTDNGFDPGDEWLFAASAGVSLTRSLDLRAGWDWLYGRPIRAAGIELDQHRELMSAGPTVGYRLGRGLLAEAGIRFPLRGRDYPAGETWSVALSWAR